MKLLAYLKITLKGIIKEFPTFLLSYAIYPIIIAMVMGYVQQDMFTPSIDNPIFSIIIVDEDNTTQSENLISFLHNEEISKIITINPYNEEKFDYTLRITKGYEESLVGGNPAKVKVEAEEKSSTSMGNILLNIVDRYNIEVSQGLVIENNIHNMKLSKEEKDELIMDIAKILNTFYTTNPINNNIYEVRKNLNSFEYYSVSFLSFAFIIFIMAVIASDSIEKENGLYSRIMSTAITDLEYFNYGLMSNYLTMLVANLLYIMAYRVTGLSFQGSFLILLLIIFIQSLMISLLGTLISILFKKKYGLPLVQFYLVFHMILGGGVGPVDKLHENKLFLFFAKYKPDILISNTFRNYILNNNLSSISKYLFMMLGLSLILYMINILAVKMKWGVKQ